MKVGMNWKGKDRIGWDGMGSWGLESNKDKCCWRGHASDAFLNLSTIKMF